LVESSISLHDLPVERPLALVFGNESVGLRRETLSSCDGFFEIPLRGFSQSLNVSVAAALALWSVLSERKSRFGGAGDLTEDERMRLRRRFYYRAVGLEDTAVLEVDDSCG
jgi:tRNA (guanosine-2'-O-)-methyltransferase